MDPTPTKTRTKLIEVALPLEAINAEGRRDKSLNRSHPKALHWWWARRPLAVCRAVVFAQLVDDPSANPDRFPTEKEQETERERLFALMRELVRWERSTDTALMQKAHDEIARCFEGTPPPVVDPFCGGGSIPVEVRRLGLEAIGSDLNPVAVLITKAMVEIPARFEGKSPVNPGRDTSFEGVDAWSGPAGLAADVAYYGARMVELISERVAPLYKDDRSALEPGDTPLAWLWARTVRCPNPACEGVIPLVNSFWLSRSSSRANVSRIWAKPVPSLEGRWVDFEIVEEGEPPQGTVFARRSIRCLLCESITSVDYAKSEGAAGRMGRQLVAVHVVANGARSYRAATLAPVVEPEAKPEFVGETLTFHPQYLQLPRYGFNTFDDLFTARQLNLLSGLVDAIPGIRDEMFADGAETHYANAVTTYLAFFVDRVAARNSAFSFWHTGGHKVEPATSTNYMPMRWFFAEANPFAHASGSLSGQLRFLVDAIESLPGGPPGSATKRDATRDQVEERVAFCTDPPYFDNIPYADLSDFYYVWLKRSLGSIYPDLFSTIVAPKAPELVADSERHGGREAAADFFRHGFRAAFDRMIAASHLDVPIVVYYALRQREEGQDGALASTGWEAMLQSLVDAGLRVTATWPVRTEQRGGLRAHGRNALATSVVISCRPLDADALVATVRELLEALRAQLPPALQLLKHESIPAVDLAQAAIGPGMAIYSGYSRVLEADGSVMPVRRALELINQVLDEIDAEQESEYDADTRFAIAWYSQFGLAEGPFGDAETLLRAKNASLDGLLAAGIVESRPGWLRLLQRDELDARWDPSTDQRLTVWEITQHLARVLSTGGERAASDLLGRVGLRAASARDLAYRLYEISERRGLAPEALDYNALVVAWPEISQGDGPTQQELEV